MQEQISPETDKIETVSEATPLKNDSVRDFIRFAVLALIIVIPVRMWVAQPFIVSGASMDPTFKNGEYLIVDELSYILHNPKRGDVVIFKYPKDEKRYYIKRVIGLPGETVSIDAEGVHIKGASSTSMLLPEPYENQITAPYPGRTLGEGEYFVMGDNRGASSDSRAWGPVPRELFVGRAYIRLFPFYRITFLPGAISTENKPNTNK